MKTSNNNVTTVENSQRKENRVSCETRTRSTKSLGRRALCLTLAVLLGISGALVDVPGLLMRGETQGVYADDLVNTVPNEESPTGTFYSGSIQTGLGENGPYGEQPRLGYGPDYGPYTVDGVVQSLSTDSPTSFAAGLPLGTIFIDQSKIPTNGGATEIISKDTAILAGLVIEDTNRVVYDGTLPGATKMVTNKVNELKGDLVKVTFADAAVLPNGDRADLVITYSNARIVIDERYNAAPEGENYYHGGVSLVQGNSIAYGGTDMTDMRTFPNAISTVNSTAEKYESSYNSSNAGSNNRTPATGLTIDVSYNIVNKDGTPAAGTFVFAICGINLDRDPDVGGGNNTAKPLWYANDEHFGGTGGTGGQDGTVYSFFSEALEIRGGQESDYVYVRPNTSQEDNPDKVTGVRGQYFYPNVSTTAGGNIKFIGNGTNSPGLGGNDNSYNAGFVTLADAATGFKVTATGHGSATATMNSYVFNSKQIWYRYTDSSGPHGTIQTTSEGNWGGKLNDGGDILTPESSYDYDAGTGKRATYVVAEGKTVTYTMTPDIGYKASRILVNGSEVLYDGESVNKMKKGDTVTVTTAAGKDGTLKYEEDGTYTFIFPYALHDEDIHVDWEPTTADLYIAKIWEDNDDEDGLRELKYQGEKPKFRLEYSINGGKNWKPVETNTKTAGVDIHPFRTYSEEDVPDGKVGEDYKDGTYYINKDTTGNHPYTWEYLPVYTYDVNGVADRLISYRIVEIDDPAIGGYKKAQYFDAQAFELTSETSKSWDGWQMYSAGGTNYVKKGDGLYYEVSKSSEDPEADGIVSNSPADPQPTIGDDDALSSNSYRTADKAIPYQSVEVLNEHDVRKLYVDVNKFWNDDELQNPDSAPTGDNEYERISLKYILSGETEDGPVDLNGDESGSDLEITLTPGETTAKNVKIDDYLIFKDKDGNRYAQVQGDTTHEHGFYKVSGDEIDYASGVVEDITDADVREVVNTTYQIDADTFGVFFDDLPTHKDGKEITYTVVERDAAGNELDGWVVTGGTLSPELDSKYEIKGYKTDFTNTPRIEDVYESLPIKINKRDAKTNVVVLEGAEFTIYQNAITEELALDNDDVLIEGKKIFTDGTKEYVKRIDSTDGEEKYYTFEGHDDDDDGEIDRYTYTLAPQQPAETNLRVKHGNVKSNVVVTNSRGVADIEFLEPGLYYVKETKAPDGYEADPTIYAFKVDRELNTISFKPIDEDHDTAWWEKLYDTLFDSNVTPGDNWNWDAASNTLTVDNEPLKGSVLVRKFWEDNDDQDGLRPKDVDATMPKVILEWTTTSHTATGLPIYENTANKKYVYNITDKKYYEVISEDQPGSYAASAADPQPERSALTETTDTCQGRKVYKDASDTKYVLVDGAYRVVSAVDTAGTIADSPATKQPHEDDLTLVMDDGTDWQVMTLDDGTGTGNEEDAIESVTHNGGPVHTSQYEAYTWNNVPAYQDGKVIVYRINESSPILDDGTYTIKYSHTSDTREKVFTLVDESSATPATLNQTIDVTNEHITQKINIEAYKTWNDEDPSKRQETTLTLYKTVNGAKSAVTLHDSTELDTGTVPKTDETDPVKVWSGLPMYENGYPITYSIVEKSISGYETTYKISYTDTTGGAVDKKGDAIDVKNVKREFYTEQDEIDGKIPDDKEVGDEKTTAAFKIENKEIIFRITGTKKWIGGEASEHINGTVELGDDDNIISATDALGLQLWRDYEKDGSTGTVTVDELGREIAIVWVKETRKTTEVTTYVNNNDEAVVLSADEYDELSPDEQANYTAKTTNVTTVTRVKQENGNGTYTVKAIDPATGAYVDPFFLKTDSDGYKYTYYIKEGRVPENYVATEKGLNVTNKDNETDTIRVTKQWDDAQDADGIRPEKVIVHLYKIVDVALTEAEKAAARGIVNEDDFATWEYNGTTYGSETEAQAAADADNADYTAINKTVNQEEYEAEQDAAEAQALAAKTASESVVQVEVAKREISYKDGEDTDENTWDTGVIWKDLPRYDDNGNKIQYIVTEESVAGYSATYSLEGGEYKEEGDEALLIELDGKKNTQQTIDIKNSLTPATNKVAVTKKWEDNNNHDGKRPENVTFQLYKYVWDQTLNSGKGGYSTTKQLVSGDSGTGRPATAEDVVAAKAKDSESTLKVGDIIKIEDLVLDGTAETGANIDTEANELTPTDANTWKGEWINLPMVENGHTVLYVIEEDTSGDVYADPDADGKVPQGKYSKEPCIHGDQVNGYTATNVYTPMTVSATVTKVWVDAAKEEDKISPRTLELELYRKYEGGTEEKVTSDNDGTTIKTTISSDDAVSTDTTGNTWSITIDNLPKYARVAKAGTDPVEYESKEYTYYWKETVPQYYRATVAEADSTTAPQAEQTADAGSTIETKNGGTITNTPKVGDATITKKFVDTDGNIIPDDLIPSTYQIDVTYKTIENNVIVEKSATLKLSDDETNHEHAYDETSGLHTWTIKDIVGRTRVTAEEQNTAEGKTIEDLLTREDGYTYKSTTVEVKGRNKETHSDINPKYAAFDLPTVAATRSAVNQGTEDTSGEINFVNTYERNMGYLEPEKIWDDNSNSDSKRPDSVTYRIIAFRGDDMDAMDNRFDVLQDPNDGTYKSQIEITLDGTIVDASGNVWGYEDPISGYLTELELPTHGIYQDTDGKWKSTWIKYVVEEVGSEEGGVLATLDYESNPAAQGTKPAKNQTTLDKGRTSKVSFTNTREPELVDVDVTKIWNDVDDEENLRPDKATFQLYKSVNGSEPVAVPGKTITLKESDEFGTECWIYDGKPYATEAEAKAAAETAQGADSGEGNYDGITHVESTKAAWTGTVEDVPKYERVNKGTDAAPNWQSVEVVYTFVETNVPKYYDASYSADGKTITNTFRDAGVIEGTKIWQDNDNIDGKRTDLTFSLKMRLWDPTLNDGAGGYGALQTAKTVDNEEVTERIVSSDISKPQEFVWANLPTYDKDGNIIKYYIVEDGADDALYETYIKYPDSDSEDEYISLEYNEAGENRHVEKVEVYNTIKDKVTIEGDKQWIDTEDVTSHDNATEITLKLYRDGTEITKDDAGNNIFVEWTDDHYVFKAVNPDYVEGGSEPQYIPAVLAKYVEGSYDTANVGHKYTYTVKETLADSIKDKYTTTYKNETAIDCTDAQKFENDKAYNKGKIVNTYVPVYDDLTATKTWDDAKDAEGLRPDDDKVIVHLYKVVTTGTGESATSTLVQVDVEAKEINKTNTKATWEDLPVYDENGKKIKYVVLEETVAGYATTYLLPGETDYVGVGAAPHTAIQLTLDGNKEAEAQNIDIKNSLTPVTDTVAVSKVWDDNDNAYGMRPASVEVELWKYVWDETTGAYGDAEKVVKRPATQDDVDADTTGSTELGDDITVTRLTLDEDNAWAGEWTNLPLTENGKTILYFVKEVTTGAAFGNPGVVNKYTNKPIITGDQINGYTVTNIFTPDTTDAEITKKWEDNSNALNVRPDTLTMELWRTWTGVDASGNDEQKYERAKDIDENDIKNLISADEKTDYNIWYYKVENLPTHTFVEKANGVKYVEVDPMFFAEGDKPQEKGWYVKNGDTYELSTDEWRQDGTTYYEQVPVTVKEAREYTYYWKETIPTGYTAEVTGTDPTEGKNPADSTLTDKIKVAADGETITNTIIPGAVKVTKTWDDENNKDGLRDAAITAFLNSLTLFADDIRVVDGTEGVTKTVETTGNTTTVTWTGLPVYSNGTKITYTATEGAIPEYTMSVAFAPAAGVNASETLTAPAEITVTNKYTPGVVELSINKIWVDKDADGTVIEARPSTITVTLTAEVSEGAEATFPTIDGVTWGTKVGNEYTATVTITGDATAESWKKALEGMPERDNKGKKITYKVSEEQLPNYTAPTIMTLGNTFTIINTYERTKLEGTKVWVDGGKVHNNETELDGKFTLNRIVEGGTAETVTGYHIHWEGNTFEITGLPKYNAAGKEYTYWLTEATVSGYLDPVYSGETHTTGTTVDGITTGGTITNTITGTTEIGGTKVWVGGEDSEHVNANLTLTLNRQSAKTGSTVESTGIKKADGTTDATVTWNGDDYSFENLPKYDSEGYEYTYWVTEAAVTGYATTYTNVDPAPAATDKAYDGATITNTSTATDSLAVTKVWDDENNAEGIRPNSIIFHLYKADGKSAGVEAITATGDATAATWSNDSWVWTGLPVYDETGAKITYKVVEEYIAGYIPGYFTEMNPTDGEVILDGASGAQTVTVTNSLTPGVTEVTVTKVWDDDDNVDGTRVPAEVKLYEQVWDEATGAYGTATAVTGKTGTLAITDNATVTFDNLPATKNGKTVIYSVQETQVAGYEEPVVTGNQVDGFTITNSREKDTIAVTVKKEWVGDEEAYRPDHVTVTLKADGTEVTVDADGNAITPLAMTSWSTGVTFNNLPKNKLVGTTSTPIVYTVEETAIKGYTTTYSAAVSGNNGTITVTNTAVLGTLTVEKTWDDDSDSAGARPDTDEFLSAISIYAEGKTVTLTQDGNVVDANDKYTIAYKDVPIYNAQGERITYEVEESAIDGYALTGGTMSGNLDATSKDLTLTLENTYDPTGVASSPTEDDALTMTKVISDADNPNNNAEADKAARTPKENEFQFEMAVKTTPAGVTMTNEWLRGRNDGNGNITFPKFWFPEPGTYTFTLKEMKGTDPTIATWDSVEHIVTATVTDNGSGKLSVEWTLDPAEEGVNATGDEVTFTNTTKRTAIEVPIRKVWVGDTDADGTVSPARPDSVVVQLKANGAQASDVDGNAISDITLNNADNYASTKVGNLPKYDSEGKEINYTVVEPNVPAGYTVSYNKILGQLLVINTLNTVEITGTKEWRDGGLTHDNTVELDGKFTVEYFDGTDWVTIDPSEYHIDWSGDTYTIKGLPKYCADEDVDSTYRVTETAPTDYIVSYKNSGTTKTDAAYNKGTIVNTIKSIDITATKVWVDNDNQDKTRKSVELQLMIGEEVVKKDADGNDITNNPVEVATGTDFDEDMTATWSNMPKYDADGNEIAYKVVEVEVPEGYTANVTGSAADGFTVTNVHDAEATSVKVTKVWVDDNNANNTRPNSINVVLYADGTPVATETITTPEDEETSATVTFEGLQKHRTGKHGEAITYTVKEETVPAGYTVAVAGNQHNGYTITNTYTEMIETIITKTWEDEDIIGGDYERPEIEVKIVGKNGSETLYEKTVTLTGNTSADEMVWTLAMALPAYIDGKKVTYSAEETVPAGYEGTTASAQGITIEAVNKPNVEEEVGDLTINIKKVDAETKEELDGAEFTLTAPDGTKTVKTTGADGVDGMVSFTLDQVGMYSLVETAAPEYYELGDVYSWTIVTDKALDRITKVVEGDTTVWKKVFNLVAVQNAEGYDVGTATLTVENPPIPPETFCISVMKKWDDDDNRDGIREEVEIKLLANGVQAKDNDGNDIPNLILNEENNYAGKFSKVPVTDKDRNPIDYTVEEVNVPEGYKSDVSGDADSGFTVTNVHEYEAITIKATKTWTGETDEVGTSLRQDVIVHLFGKVDGKVVYDAGSKKIAKNDDPATATWTVPKYNRGKEMTWQVTEEAVPGYTTTITSEDGKSFEVVNEYIVLKDTTATITVEKVWEDDNNVDGARPTSVTFELWKKVGDGEPEKVDEQKVTAADDWSHTWNNLKVVEKTQTLVETVVENDDAASDEGDATGESGDSTGSDDTATGGDESGDGSDSGSDDTTGTESGSDDTTGTEGGDDTTTSGDEGTSSDTTTSEPTVITEVVVTETPILYTVKEAEVGKGYTGVVQQVKPGEFVATNIRERDTVAVSVTKAWSDNKDEDGVRPSHVSVWLEQSTDGSTWTEVKNADGVLTEANGWTLAFRNLLKNDDSGNKIKYRVREKAVDGYEAAYTGEGLELTITNTRDESPKLTLEVTKEWLDENGDTSLRKDVTFHLMKVVEGYGPVEVEGEEKTLAADATDLTVKWTDLPSIENGKKVTYTVEEDQVPGYTTTYTDGVTENNTIKITVKNTKDPDPEKITIKYTDPENEDETKRLVLEKEIERGDDEPAQPGDPTREGYIFKGWKRTVDPETGDVTYEAQWEKEKEPGQKTITYIDESKPEGEQVVQTETIDKDKEESDQPADPTREGYTFGGWLRDVDEDGNVTYKANWIKNPETPEPGKKTVVYVDPSRPEDDQVLQEETIDRDKEEKAQPEDPTREGYTFGGWLREVTEDGNVIYKANWIENEHRVTFVDPHAEDNMILQSSNFNTKDKAEAATGGDDVPTPSHDGYVFTGWAMNEVDGDYIMVAKYNKVEPQAKITFIDPQNSGEEIIISTEDLDGKNPTEIEAPTPEDHDGLQFVGWEYAQDANGNWVAAAKYASDCRNPEPEPVVSDVTKKVTRTIHYRYTTEDGKEAFKDVVQTITLTREKIENPDGTVEYTEWTADSMTLAEIPSPAKDGYTANKSSIKALEITDEMLEQEGDIFLEETVVYTKNAEPPQRWVTYVDSDGKTIYLPQTYFEEGKEPAAPANPSKDGYTFCGWTRTEDSAGNLIYYAIWEPVKKEDPAPTPPPAEPAKPSGPSTGDDNKTAEWLLLMALSAACAAAIEARRRMSR